MINAVIIMRPLISLLREGNLSSGLEAGQVIHRSEIGGRCCKTAIWLIWLFGSSRSSGY